tara:strand:- start:28 stop:201 length:174 start_codon:yes stop_codon:yes gene_type:complete
MTTYCPKCSSTNMSYGEPEVTYQAYTIELPLTCAKCKHKWIDVFTFDHLEEDTSDET